MVPQRRHGSKYNSPHLPSQTPIIGLGCSSFSSFFMNESSKKNSQDQVKLSGVCQSNAHETVKKSDPTVQSWIQTIHYAIEKGITLLDTAPWYGHGTSEVVIGYAMEEYSFTDEEKDEVSVSYSITAGSSGIGGRVKRKDLIINTKVGRYDSDPNHQFDYTYNTTIQSVKRSIRRMKCQYIDVIQIHDPEFVHPHVNILFEETIPALLHCRDELRIVKGIGLTGYPLEVQYHILKEVMKNDHSSSFGNKVVFDQCLTYCHFNLHSQALLTKPIQEMDGITPDMKRETRSNLQDDPLDNEIDKEEERQSFVQYCKERNIPLMAAAPLSMGLLTPNSPPNWHPAPQSLQDACHKASIIAKEYNNVDLPTLAIIFALSCGDISCTLLGMANKKQVDVALDVVKRIGNVSFEMYDNVDASVSNDGEKNDMGSLLRKKVQSTLREVLTKDEMNVLSILMDTVNGPFAKVWSNGEYEWDGMLEAEKFWSSIAKSE